MKDHIGTIVILYTFDFFGGSCEDTLLHRSLCNDDPVVETSKPLESRVTRTEGCTGHDVPSVCDRVSTPKGKVNLLPTPSKVQSFATGGLVCVAVGIADWWGSYPIRPPTSPVLGIWILPTHKTNTLTAQVVTCVLAILQSAIERALWTHPCVIVPSSRECQRHTWDFRITSLGTYSRTRRGRHPPGRKGGQCKE